MKSQLAVAFVFLAGTAACGSSADGGTRIDGGGFDGSVAMERDAAARDATAPDMRDAGTSDGGAVEARDAGASDAHVDPVDASTGVEGSPRFLSFSWNPLELTPTQPVVFTAIVTDPDGIEDVIGGELIDVATDRTYGPFVSPAQEGAYSFTLTWGMAQATTSIDAPAGGVTRAVRVRFFDVAGHSATRDVALRLRCDEGLTACAGQCVDLQTSRDHCGACGRAVVPQALVCRNGVPECGGGAGLTYCSEQGRCANLMGDELNCGQCGRNVLPALCANGLPSCRLNSGGPDYCESPSACTHLSSDERNCGVCGRTCDANTPLCTEGSCRRNVVSTRSASCGELCRGAGLRCGPAPIGWASFEYGRGQSLTTCEATPMPRPEEGRVRDVVCHCVGA